jgi:hypothetical protein
MKLGEAKTTAIAGVFEGDQAKLEIGGDALKYYVH